MVLCEIWESHVGSLTETTGLQADLHDIEPWGPWMCVGGDKRTEGCNLS